MGRFLQRAAAVGGVYVAAAVLLTWPLAAHPMSRLGALEGIGDPYLVVWILGWGSHAWVTDPLSVLSGRVFDANIFHPAAGTLSFNDHLLLQSLALSPLYALTHDPVLCYNVLVILSLALSGVAMHVFARAITGSTLAAFAAGLAWAMWSYRTARLFHLNLQSLYFMPLALLFLHRLAAGRRTRDAAALGLTAALQAISSVYYGVMTALALIVSASALAWTTGQWRSKPLIARLALAASIGALVVLPFVLPYLRSQEQFGFGRTLDDAATYGAGVRSYTQVSPENLLYGATGLLSPRPTPAGERDRTGVEHRMFPGFVIVVLAVCGVWSGWRRDTRPTTMAALALIVVGVVLSLGPEGVRPIYATLHRFFFGFDAIRAPARFGVMAMVGLITLGALGFAALERSPRLAERSRRVWLLVPLALLVVEYVNVPLPLAPAPPRTTPIGQWLRSASPPGAVLHLPIDRDVENSSFMVQSLEHRRPLVNGYSGQRPAFYSAVVETLSTLPSVEAYAMLRELDVRFVVSPRSIEGAGRADSPLRPRADLVDGVVYEVVWTREAEALLEAAGPGPPPPRGPLPFQAGERLTYDVTWETGPLDISAGTAILTVSHPEDPKPADTPRARWVFEARATTADWVSSFFEARDRFRTTADEALRPLEHTREIRERRRRVDQTYLFDPAARVVRAGPTADAAAAAVTLPVPADVRDALTALYYVRTLPLDPDADLTLPINDAGRNMTLRLRVAGLDTLQHQGGPVSAWRIEPRVIRLVERRRPPTATVWISADARRLPLVIEVAAGFGRVRASLVDDGRR